MNSERGHKIQTCIPVRARDGAVLSTDLYLPRAGTSFPLGAAFPQIFWRTP